jgi:hypothetical protein
MNEELADIFMLTIPTAILIIAWLTIRIKSYPKSMFSLILVANIFFGAAYGLITYKETGADGSRLSFAIIYPSTIYLNGPLLISTLKEKVNKFWLFLFAIILAPFSVAITLIILLFSGQIYI